MIDAAKLLAGLPTALRKELIDAYAEIVSNYVERRWGPSELSGGKFCEIGYSIIEGALSGTFPPKASKPKNMVQSCTDLERRFPPDPNRVGDRSLRIMLPRLLPVLYEVRNNRNVGHVGGDVDPNHMDAEAVMGMASWVMAELVRIFHGVSTGEAQESVAALVERKTPLIWEIGGIKRVLDHEMSAKDKSLLLLHHSTGWVEVSELFNWIEYSNLSVFRSSVLKPMHKARLIEFDATSGKVRISPKGAADTEARLLRTGN